MCEEFVIDDSLIIYRQVPDCEIPSLEFEDWDPEELDFIERCERSYCYDMDCS